MPMALPIIGAAFIAAGTIATALGVAAVAFTIGTLAVTWAAVATIVGVAILAVSMLTMKTPKPSSSAQQLQTVLNPKAPVPIAYGRTASGGAVYYDDVSGAKNRYLHRAIALSVGGPIQGVELVLANDIAVNFSGDPTTAARLATGTTPYSKKLYTGKLAMRYLLGTTPGISIDSAMGAYGGMPGSPGAASGIATAIFRADYEQEYWPQGLPAFKFVFSGVKVYDPRLDTTYPGGSGTQRIDDYSTWTFSKNPYLCALNWTLGKFQNGKKIYGIGAKPSEVDIAAFVRGANIADANGWECGGVVTTADNKFAVLATILQAGGGLPIARGAQISCYVHAPTTTLTTITRDDVIGEIEIQNTSSFRDRHNTVVPSYREETQFWEIVQGEELSEEVYVEEDNGQLKTQEVEFVMVQNAAQAHQLAAYELVNSREFLTFTMATKVRMLDVRIGDSVVVDIPEIAADEIKCLVINREFNPADLMVTLTLKSETDAKHAYALGQSQEAPASPSLNGYDPTDMDEPGEVAWEVTGETITAEGNSTPILRVAGANDNPYTRDIIVEYRVLGETTWIQQGVYPRDTTEVEIFSVTSGTQYEVAITYRSILNVLSDRTIYGPVTAGSQIIDWGNVGNAPDFLFSTGPWEEDRLYHVNELFTIDGVTYIVTVEHTSSAGDPPPNDNCAVFSAAGETTTVGYLTNEAHILLADAAGTPDSTSLTDAGGTFVVYHGSTDVTTSSDFDIQSLTSGLTLTINATTGVYAVTAMTVNTGIAVLQATYGGVTVQRTYSITKAINGKSVRVTSSRQTISFNTSGTVNPTQYVELLASKTNIDSSTYKWSIKTNTNVAVVTDQITTPSGGTLSTHFITSGTTAALSGEMFDSYLDTHGGTGLVFTVKMEEGASTFTDSITVIKVSDGVAGDDGQNAYVGYLTNEAHTVPADGAGNVISGSLTSAGGTFVVLDGATTATGVTYSVQSATSGLTISINSTTGVYAITGLTVDTAVATLRAVYAGVNIDKVYTISKSRSGKLMVLEAGKRTLNLFAGGTVKPSQTFEFTARRVNSTATVSWTVTLYDGTVVINNVTATTGDFNISGLTADISGSSFNVLMGSQASATVKAQFTDNGVTYSDSITISKIFDGTDGTNGQNAITGLLTNESHTIAADYLGAITGSYASAGGTFRVYEGTTEKTTSGSVTYSVFAESNVDLSINSSGVYTVASLTADTATATLRAVYAGVTLDKVYTISKVRAGSVAPETEFEWSVNGTTGWHSTYTVGDLFLRTSTDGGSTWSAAVRVVGEDGVDGDSGSDAQVLTLTCDRQTITYSDGGATLNPATQTTTFTTIRQNLGTGTTWTIKSADGTTLTPTSTYMTTSTTTATLTAAQFETARGTTEGVIVTATSTDNTACTDTISVVRVIHGSSPFVLTTSTASTTALGPNSVTRYSGSGYGTSGAMTTESYKGSVSVGFTATTLSVDYAVGLDASPEADNNYTAMEYCFVLSGSNSYSVYENNTFRVGGSYTTGSRFEISRQNGTIRYTINGLDVRTTTDVTSDAALRGDFSISTALGRISGITFGPTIATGLVAFLTNEAHTVAADSAGTVSSFSGAGGTMKVFNGEVDITTSCAFTVQAETGVDVSIGSSSGVYSVNSMSSDTGTATFRATYAGKTVDRIYTIAKSKAGSTGNRQQYVFKRSATQPSTPTGNNIPSGWFDAPPTDDGNPAWASVATQSSAGVTVGSWSTPFKVTGVDGVDGVDGTDGTSAGYIDIKFIRSIGFPSTPPMSQPNPSGWSDGVPPGNYTLYSIRARKTFAGAMVTGWTAPVKIGDPTARGGWAEGQSYIAYDTVIYNGGYYIATVDHTSVLANAPSGTSTSNSYWDVIAAPGETGASGTPPPTLTTTITVTAGEGLINLRALADAAGYTGQQNANITFNIHPAINTGRFGLKGPAGGNGGNAIDTGEWPLPSLWTTTLTLNIRRNVYGGGGGGGDGGSYGPGAPGGNGGDAIYMRFPIRITCDSGTAGIFAGGGGGGGGGAGKLTQNQVVWRINDRDSDPSVGTLVTVPCDMYFGGGGGGGGAPNGTAGRGGEGVRVDTGATTNGSAGTNATSGYTSIGSGIYGWGGDYNTAPQIITWGQGSGTFNARVYQIVGSGGTGGVPTTVDGSGNGAAGLPGQSANAPTVLGAPTSSMTTVYTGGAAGVAGYAIRRNGHQLQINFGTFSTPDYKVVTNNSSYAGWGGAAASSIKLYGLIG